jgi:hypothetical protein
MLAVRCINVFFLRVADQVGFDFPRDLQNGRCVQQVADGRITVWCPASEFPGDVPYRRGRDVHAHDPLPVQQPRIEHACSRIVNERRLPI